MSAREQNESIASINTRLQDFEETPMERRARGREWIYIGMNGPGGHLGDKTSQRT